MNKIIANFRADWYARLREELRLLWGAQADTIPDRDLPVRYFDSQRRRLSARPRKLELASDFTIPNELADGWRNFAGKVIAGEPLQPHLSKKHQSLVNSDGLLNDWNVHHFHLGVDPHPENSDLVERTGPVVFAMVTDDCFYAIKIRAHGGWAELEVVEALHREWPQAIACYIIHGLSADHITETQRITIRRKHTNCFVTVSDGTMYGPLGGGVTAAGTSVLSQVRADMAAAEIDSFQRNIEFSCDTIVEQLKARHHHVSGNIEARLAFLNNELAVYLPAYNLTLQIDTLPAAPQ